MDGDDKLTTDWIHRIIIIVPANQQALANNALATIWPGGDAEEETMTVPLSPDGAEPPTHYGAFGSLTEFYWQAAQTVFDTVPINWQWWRLDTDEILRSRSGTGAVDVYFSWQDALTEAGLLDREEL